MDLMKRSLWMLLLSLPLPVVAAPTIVEEGYRLASSWSLAEAASAIYHPKDGFVYALRRKGTADGVYRLSTSGTITLITTASIPASLAVDLSGNLYYSEDYGGSIDPGPTPAHGPSPCGSVALPAAHWSPPTPTTIPTASPLHPKTMQAVCSPLELEWSPIEAAAARMISGSFRPRPQRVSSCSLPTKAP